MRVTLNGPDALTPRWISKGQRPPLGVKWQNAGGGLQVWAAIIQDELVGPLQVEDGLPDLLPVFRRHFLPAVVQEESCSFQNDNAEQTP